MSTATATTALDDLLDAYTLLEGEDDYTMGDPGPMGATGQARQALYELLQAVGCDPYADGFAGGYARNDRANAPVEAEQARLGELERAAADARWLNALKEIPNSDLPLATLKAAESRAVVAKAASALNRLDRTGLLHSVARNLVLIGLLRRIAGAAEGDSAETIAGYARLLELQNRRIVLWNDVQIGIEAGTYYEYAGKVERYQGDKMLAEDYEQRVQEQALPYETTAADWRLAS